MLKVKEMISGNSTLVKVLSGFKIFFGASNCVSGFAVQFILSLVEGSHSSVFRTLI